MNLISKKKKKKKDFKAEDKVEGRCLGGFIKTVVFMDREKRAPSCTWTHYYCTSLYQRDQAL